ncbi:MAG: 4-carboxy-4-hydroxy-2-oxoadipate aldolase/oxaloacetate decarboxylase [Xanthomonadaceae bacterium]|nr:4-carboxy-4-hydroxy-2-oxoadipate aldolase/oxaloacetate decarboxylase [Xanthomonadaceae bacterium]
MPEARIDPSATTRLDIERASPSDVASARHYPSATLHEAAGKTGALPSAIRPIAPGFRLCGPAVTVAGPGGDNLWIHRALYAAQPGDILVVHAAQAYEHGYWGEVMSTAARVRGLGGLVIDGGVRDLSQLAQIGFPVFARGLCIRGTGKDFGARGWINAPVLIGDACIHAGDLIVGDEDGVVVVAREQVQRVVAGAAAREEQEKDILARLRAGETTLSVYGWD